MDPASTFWSPSTFDGVFNFFFVTPRLWDNITIYKRGVCCGEISKRPGGALLLGVHFLAL